MKFKELLKRGVYGIKDISIDKIVYIGSTNRSFCERMSFHLNQIRRNEHPNPRLTKLIKSGNFEFIILDSGNYSKKELLNKERYYSELYKMTEEGYNINIGGCRPIKCSSFHVKQYEINDKYIRVKDYIDSNYLNIRIGPEQRQRIIEFVNKLGFDNISTRNFVINMRKFNYEVTRLATRRDYILSHKAD